MKTHKNKIQPECITCGSRKVEYIPRYFVIPGSIVVSNSYLLCNDHKHLNYYFNDIYDEEGKRKPIDHEKIINRK